MIGGRSMSGPNSAETKQLEFLDCKEIKEAHVNGKVRIDLDEGADYSHRIRKRILLQKKCRLRN